ncbi:MAG TPA: hypothetical protein GXZ24_07125 [Firmicutes bacterium]|jgi:proteasome lid subunit RPN8/RPN11|nr:hypothetical protein [Bacillota bacterium]
MRNQPSKQSFADEIKKEVMRDLESTFGHRQHLVNSIKQEVLMELGQHPGGQLSSPDQALVEAIRDEVLVSLGGVMRSHPVKPTYPARPDRATIESIKSEVIAQIEAEQEALENKQQQDPDPALVQTIKDSVMAEMHFPYQR